MKEGDKVAMLLPNIPQMVIANHAVYRLGAVTAMNNPLYTERELAHQLDDSDATMLVTLDLLLPRALKLKAETKIRTIITCHISDYLPFPKKQLFPYVKKPCSGRWSRSRVCISSWISSENIRICLSRTKHGGTNLQP